MFSYLDVFVAIVVDGLLGMRLVIRVGFVLFPLRRRRLLIDLIVVSLNGPDALYNLGKK